MTAADGLEILHTRAYKAALRQLMAAGTWVPREDLAGCAQSPVALEDALADLVMLGQADYQQGAGYRIKQPAVVRQAAKALLAQPDLRERVDLRQVPGGVHLGMARRTGPGELDVLMFGMVVPAPDGATDGECLSHAAALQATVGRAWDQEEKRGRAGV
ncbi:hypothetical protein [Hydrogenophaga sp.]|uniref:hypothetical protein n=1 Tax=Hydrogenophaga sp. TaxID=1904254 RepID=UPI003D144DD6